MLFSYKGIYFVSIHLGLGTLRLLSAKVFLIDFQQVCEAFCGVHEGAPFMASWKSGFYCDSMCRRIRNAKQSLL